MVPKGLQMASIEKRGNRYTVRWRDPDGALRRRSFHSLAAAKEHKKEVEDCVAAGHRWEPRDARPLPDLGFAVTAYLTHLHTRARPRTVLNVGHALQNFAVFLGGDLSKKKLGELSQALLERFYLWLGKPDTGRHGKARSLDTRKKNVEIVQTFWAWCAEQDDLSPTTPPPRRLRALPRDPVEPTRAPTWAEMDATIAAAGAWYPLALGVMRAFGLRVVQAMGLRVGDIDTAACTLKVRGELGKSKQERAGRVVPYGETLQPFLVPLTAGRDPGEWLVPSRRARGLREREVRTEYVSGAWHRAGVRPDVWAGRPDHAFRKGFVSELRRAGADSDAVEVLVGHSLGLRGVYTDADALPLRKAVSLVPAFSEPALAAMLSAISTETEKDGAK